MYILVVGYCRSNMWLLNGFDCLLTRSRSLLSVLKSVVVNQGQPKITTSGEKALKCLGYVAVKIVPAQ